MSISSYCKVCGQVVALTVGCSSAQKADDSHGGNGGNAGAVVAKVTVGGAGRGGDWAGAGTRFAGIGGTLSNALVSTGGTDNLATSKAGGGSTGTDGRGGSGGTASGNEGGLASGVSVGGTGESGCPALLTDLGHVSGDGCSVSEIATEASSINVLIVLDESGSMAAVPAGDTTSKWAGVTSALVGALNPSDSSIRYGLLLFPYALAEGASRCELATGEAAVNIQVGPATETIPQIIQIMKETEPQGGTPTAAALASAYEYYLSGAGKSLKGQKYVLLVTDGGPNCNTGITCEGAKCTANMDKTGTCGIDIENCCDPANVTTGGDSANLLCLDDGAVSTQIQALLRQGIKTFVVGIPGTEAYATYLDGFAESGGLPVTPTADKPHKYYEVRNDAEFVTAFQNITGSLVRSCVVPLAAKAIDPTKLNVAVDCKALPQSSPGVVHWEYHANSQSIEIKGTECDRITTQGVGRIDVITGCPTVVAH